MSIPSKTGFIYKSDTPTPAVSSADDICEACGAVLVVGSWPWCPHGLGVNAVQDDSIIGGEVIENLTDKPITVYSKSERKRLLKETGHDEFVRHIGTPGSDKSPHTTRWT